MYIYIYIHTHVHTYTHITDMFTCNLTVHHTLSIVYIT